MKKMPKAAIIGIVIGIAVVIAVIVILLLVRKGGDASKGEYRTISVFDIVGDVTVTRDKEDMVPYVNMQMLSGDLAKTEAESYLQMLLDEDKYVHVESESEISFVAKGTATDSKTTFEIKKGGIANSIHNKLSEDSEYVVNTPNATMAVRGTTFRVNCYYDNNGIFHTVIEVFSGEVEARLVYPDGTIGEEIVIVKAGRSASIWMDDKSSGWDYKDGEIDLPSLPLDTVRFLKLMSKKGEKMFISDDEIDELIRKLSQIFSVTFVNDGQLFGTQQIQYGKKATKPKLQPTKTGQWDFDFATKIVKDTMISWQDMTEERVYND